MIRDKRTVLMALFLCLAGSMTLHSQEQVFHAHEGLVDQFNIELWVDRGEASVYYPGERLRVYFRPSHDSYIVVYGIDTEGLIRVLYPYGYDDDSFVAGGRTRRVPDAWDHHDLMVSGPSGIEYVVAVASLYPISVPRWRRYYDTRYESPAGLVDHITGDPYEGILLLTETIIPAEHREFGYVTNSTYFYVEQRVWYPRYMCYDCHWPRPAYFHPYVDVCLGFEIVIVDYDWYDDWAYWRPHHPPVRYRHGCWTVRRRDRAASLASQSERYSRRRGFKNVGFSKTDVEPVDKVEIRRVLEDKSTIDRHRGSESSPPPAGSKDFRGKDVRGMERSGAGYPEPANRDDSYRRYDKPRSEGAPIQKPAAGEVKRTTSPATKEKQNVQEKISDGSKKNQDKGTSDDSKSKVKTQEKKSSQPSKVSSPSKQKSESKAKSQPSPQKKGSTGSSGKSRRKE